MLKIVSFFVDLCYIMWIFCQ